MYVPLLSVNHTNCFPSFSIIDGHETNSIRLLQQSLSLGYLQANVLIINKTYIVDMDNIGMGKNT